MGTRAFGAFVVLFGLAVTVSGTGSPPVADRTPDAAAPERAPEPNPVADLRDDPRVRAFVQTYGERIDSIAYGTEDVVFAIAGRSIHFKDGRLLEGDRLGHADRCDPLFYEYPLEPLREAVPVEGRPTYCTHWQEILWGRTEGQVREHGRSTTFLNHRMFVNELLVDPLARAERALAAAARTDRAVRGWIDELNITYSFIDREIAGSDTRSQHAYGFAVDFVPRSYGGRPVYWRWSRALDREGWTSIPLERRWSPPERVIEIFEDNGFVWGGKWGYFDNMHFEYRPEILLYSRLVAG